MSDVALRRTGDGSPVEYRSAADWPALQALIALSVRPEPNPYNPTDRFIAPWRFLCWLDAVIDDSHAAALMAAGLYTPIPEPRPWLFEACDTVHDLLAGVEGRCTRVTLDQATDWAQQVLKGHGMWSNSSDHQRQVRAARRFLDRYNSRDLGARGEGRRNP